MLGILAGSNESLAKKESAKVSVQLTTSWDLSP